MLNEKIRQVLEQGATAVLVTVVQVVDESRELRVGAKLLVTSTGQSFGALGDSRLETAVATQAEFFSKSRDDARTWTVSEFAPDLGELHNVRILFERIETEPQLVIAGAGHVGASLARLAAQIGYRVTLIDDRAEFVAREKFASSFEQSIELVFAADWAQAIAAAIGKGRGVSVAIVTRGHKQDEDCLRATIAKNPDYIGMIGSRRRTNIVLDKLREEGSSDEQLRKVRAPIGLDIGAVSPEEVALAILAEIVAERRGGRGSSLSAWRRS
jgi:xanthine dehydrogenase accessory factor